MASTRFIPTFLLKGVDPNKLLADYQAGVFSRPITPKAPITISQNTTVLARSYGATNQSPIFSIKDRNNNSVVFATTNHTGYELFTKNGGELPVGGRCDFCKEDFTNVSMGYPLAYQERDILTRDEQNIGHYRIFYTFWIEPGCCSFECSLAELRKMTARPADDRDVTYRDAEIWLKYLFRLTYPNAGLLLPAQDPKLLKSNGGSLTKEEWKDNRHVYTRTDRVLLIPVKVEYIRSNLIQQPVTIDIVNMVEVGSTP